MAIELTIPSSKADQLGKGCKLFIAQTKDSICPVNLITKYMAVRPKGNGQSFIHFDTSPHALSICFSIKQNFEINWFA